jgi:hypothetical protein
VKSPTEPNSILRLDRRLKLDGREIRFTSQLDAETLRFEEELCALPGIDLPYMQRHVFLATSRRPFLLLQTRTPEGVPAAQIAVHIHRSSSLRSISRGLTPRLGTAVSDLEETAALSILSSLCAEIPGLITLRLQPFRRGADRLATFEQNARKSGFVVRNSLEYTQTLLFDLRMSAEQLPLTLSRKTRTKLRHRCREEIELRLLTDHKYIPQCKAALEESFKRTGGNPNQFDFEAAFDTARARPDRVHIVGLFHKDRPEQLLAFVTALYGGGEIAEYNAAGSLPDPVLRKMPFNYLLIWELIEWAHRNGASWLDLGGVTPGGEDDPRASISEFKRHLSEVEMEVGREMEITLKPGRAAVFNTLTWVKDRSREASTRLALGVMSALLCFVLGSTVIMRRAGSPASPARVALAGLLEQGRQPDLAVIGDSRAHVGISPAILASTLAQQGLPLIETYNFAVDGTDVLHQFSFGAHGLLDSAKPPRVIIWAANPLQFNGSRHSNRLEQLTLRDVPSLYSAGAPMEMLLDLGTMSVFSAYRQRPLMQHLVFEDYGGRAAIRTLPLQEKFLHLQREIQPVSREYHEREAGWEPFTVLNWDDRFQRGAQTYLKDYDALELSEMHFKLARDLMRRARKTGTLLIALETPIAPFFQNGVALQAKHQEWRARIQAIAREEGALFWSDANLLHDDRLFGDPGHMPESTAQEYSRYLAAKLATDTTVRAALQKKERL